MEHCLVIFKYIGFFLVFLVLIYSQPNVGGAGLLMPNNTALWFLVGLIVIASIYVINQKSKIAVSNFASYFTFVLIIIFSTSLINADVSIEKTLIFTYAIFGMIFYFYSLYQWKISHSNFLKILLFLSVVGLFHAFVSVIQLHDNYHVLYVWTGYLPFNLAGARPLGIVQQVNMNATLLASVLVANLYLMTHVSFKRYKWYWQGLVIASNILSLYILLLSGSRAGLLAFIIGSVVMLFARFKGIKKNGVSFGLWIFSGLIGVVLALNFPGSTANIDLLDDKFNKILMGTDIRLFLYSSGWSLFWQSPWLGYGLGGYTQALIQYVQQYGAPEQIENMKLVEFLHPHNEILYWMLQSGVVAFVGVFALTVLYLRTLFRQRVRFAIGILGLAMPMLIQAQLSSPFVFSSIHLILPLFFLHYGIRNDKRMYSFKLNEATKRLVQIGLILMVVALSYFAWFTLMSIKDAHNYEYRLFLTAKQTPEEIADMRYFEYASLHPAFSGTVHGVMNNMVQKALSDGNLYDIQRFIWWAEEQKLEDRSELTIVNLANAQRALKY